MHKHRWSRSCWLTATVGNLLKLRADGTADRAFGRKGMSRIPMGGVDRLAVDGKGRLLAGGWNGGAAVFRMRPGGGPDRTFAGGAAVRLPDSGPAAAVAVQRGGGILAPGTPRPDAIAALGGKDKVRGLGGADLICGGRGKDSLGGGPGRDRVRQ